MTDYFVKNGGNDAASGLDDANAWETLAKVLATSAGSDTRFFLKCGSVWRERLRSYYSGTAGSPIVFDAYGSGAKPLVMGGAYDLWTDDAWADQGSNIWRHTGLTTAVGNLVFNLAGTPSCGTLQANVAACTVQGDFCYDATGDYVDMYSTSDPHDAYTSIEGAIDLQGFSSSSVNYQTVRNIAFRACGGNAVDFSTVTGGLAEHCDIAFCGGGVYGARYGNGIQFINDIADCMARWNVIDNVYDEGLTYQSYNNDVTADGIRFYGNLVSNSNWGISLYTHGTGTTQNGIVVAHNTFYNNGGSWGTLARAGYGVYIYNTNSPTVTNCVCKDNIFHTSKTYHIYGRGAAQIGGWTFNNNCYYPDGATLFCYNATEENFAAWKASTSGDAASIVTDPQFRAEFTDFRLALGSPCVDAGAVIADVEWGYRGAAPDMGYRECWIPSPLPSFRTA